MARDVSIVISAKDNFSDAITTMRRANQSFNKDLTGLTSKMDALNKKKIMLKVDADKAKMSLKEAEKQFKATGDAADKMNLELASMNYENARRNLGLVSQNAKQAEKDILNLTRTTSKVENRAGSEKSLIGSLAEAGLTQLVGSTLSNTANAIVGSAYGSEAGTMFSGVLSSAATGAAIGSLIPGIGTAIGAAVGGLAGAITGATSIYENKDDAFKNYYQEQYNSVLENQLSTLASGKNIASTREQNRISFATLLGGESQATEFLDQLTQFASETPFEYDDLTNISKVLLAYGYKQDELLPLLGKVGDAGSALGMSTEDMKYVATALGRMQTTGKTTMEYLNPLLERGIDVWSYLSEASGKTKKEVQEMVSKGLVPGGEAAKAIADYMGFNFAGNMEKQAQTYSGLLSTLEDAQAELNNAMGEGYLEERKQGLQEEIDYLSNNKEMEGAYKQIGQWKASLENLSEEYERDALNSVMTGATSNLFNSDTQSRLNEMYSEYTKYASAGTEEAGAKMGALLAEAQVIANNEYNASEGAQIALQSNKDLAENIKNDTSLQSDYWDAGYEMGMQFSKGLASAIGSSRDDISKSAQPNVSSIMDLTPEEAMDMIGMATTKKTSGASTNPNISGIMNLTPEEAKKMMQGYAYGLSYVPYDNYPVMLHQGERILTASENRNYGTGTPITITGNNFTVREEADIKKIAQELAIQINMAYQLAI